MKTVDFIVPAFLPPYWGGTETVLKTLEKKYSESPDKRIKINFIIPFNSTEGYIFNNKQENHFYPTARFKSKRLVKLIGLLYLVNYFFRTKTDEIIIISPNIIDLAKFCSFFNRKYKIVSWVHFSLSHRFSNRQKTFNKADYHMAISSGIKKQLVNMGIEKEKISVIYNPISKKEKTIPQSKVASFVYVGRVQFLKQKNLQELIRACSIFNEKVSEWNLSIFGDGSDIEMVKRLVSDLGLSEHIEFMGWSDDPWIDIDSATALIMTSTYEGLPMASLEALSYGIPVISSDIETGPDDEINPMNGKLYELGNVEKLAELMLELSNQNSFYSRDNVKKSIKKFYSDEYFSNLTEVLVNIGEKR
ncbi:glycosyltransferase [Leuconostoc mesenteroides]|uniref:glycosyltransferase n=1 Tax=Leuconostoc mesenteroides TaxID=1245 RepID=UPI0032DE88EE